MTRAQHDNHQPPWRLGLVAVVIVALAVVVCWKLLDLQVLDNTAAQREGDARTVRTDVLVATRGNIVDRNGEPLAISTPVLSLWLNPKEVLEHPEQGARLEAALRELDLDPAVIGRRITEGPAREFMWLKRMLPPADAQAILSLGLKGVYAREEYKRFYPMGEAAVHVVGLTNADEVGQEGLELAYDDWLRGTPGARQVLKDRLGRIIRELRVDNVAQPGNDLVLSIDSRLQYLAYKALKEAVTLRNASAGTATVLDVRTGEVLAMVSQPSYNPNNRSSIKGGELPNRAMVSLLEPGSTVKTFTVTAALETGLFDTSSVIETSPGYIRVDRTLTTRDPVNYGPSTLERIMYKSSQVGASKLALAMGEKPMLDVLQRVGLGQSPGTGFPGEEAGIIPNRPRWAKSEIATMSYGYGFQVTPLQLASAYLVYANRGIRKPVSLLRVYESVKGERVLREDIVDTVNEMLRSVVDDAVGGTGVRARIPSYQVAGKTGTAWYYEPGKGYDNRNYNSYFAGFAPASDPRVVIVISIHQPKGDEYGGGQVAAPVFAQIAAGAMRILNVPPDSVVETPAVGMAPRGGRP